MFRVIDPIAGRIESSMGDEPNTLDAYLSTVSQRTIEVTKYLTVMSAGVLPLSVVVGFFGHKHWL